MFIADPGPRDWLAKALFDCDSGSNDLRNASRSLDRLLDLSLDSAVRDQVMTLHAQLLATSDMARSLAMTMADMDSALRGASSCPDAPTGGECG